VKTVLQLRGVVDRHPFAADAVLAVVIALFVQQEIWLDDGYLSASKALYVSTGLAMTLPLAWRRRAPLAVLVVVMGSLAVEAIAAGSAPTPDAPLVGWLLATYTVAAHCERQAALAGLAFSVAAGTVWIGFDDIFFPVVVLGGAWFAGRLVRQRLVHAIALEERAAALERDREANVRAAAADERARIARELHDVVAHTLGVIVVQAGAERLHLSAGSETHTAFASIERAGRGALEEMGRLLGVLRADDEHGDLVPQPGLRRLGSLLEDVRSTGLDIELVVEGEERPLGAGADVSAYRIVQEALTNAVRHSGSRHARVSLRWEATVLEIEVADDGIGPPAEQDRNGHGLLGIRERVSLFGGALVTGRSDLGGFQVVARLPLGGS
jgi:signal transduction histidine kinase